MGDIKRILEAILVGCRWLVAPFLLGLGIGLAALLVQFGIKLVSFVGTVWSAPPAEVIVGILTLVDLTLTANLILIVVFSAFENYIRKVEPAAQPQWPPGLIDIDFSAVKQKLLGSITGIAAVDALAWYLHLEEYADTAKLTWVVVFPLMFVVAMALLALADRLARTSHEPTQ